MRRLLLLINVSRARSEESPVIAARISSKTPLTTAGAKIASHSPCRRTHAKPALRLPASHPLRKGGCARQIDRGTGLGISPPSMTGSRSGQQQDDPLPVAGGQDMAASRMEDLAQKHEYSES